MNRTGSMVAATISAWGMTLYGALLPFHAFGNIPARRWTVLEPCELVLLVASPAIACELVRARRRLLASWIVRGVLSLAFAGILAELLSPSTSGLVILQEALAPLAVCGVASTVLSGRARVLIAGVLAGGIVALSVSAVGYGLALSTDLSFAKAFVFASEHPLFPGWPRMTGTLGRHAVWLGEYCVMLLAVALAANDGVASRSARIGARVAAVGGLVASVSFAWFGGLVLMIRGWLISRTRAGASRPRHQSIAGLGLLFAYAGVTFWMILGAPIEPSAHSSPRHCRELDGAHHVLRHGPAPGLCRPVLSSEPYSHRLTLYALAHQTAWQRFVQRPLVGGGQSGYSNFARAHAARVHSLGPMGYYQEPVGLVASTLAYKGLVGGVALTVMLYGIWRARPWPSARLPWPASGTFHASNPLLGTRIGQWLFYGAVALLLCGTQTDFELRGPLWVLIGLLAGFSDEHAEIAAVTPPE